MVEMTWNFSGIHPANYSHIEGGISAGQQGLAAPVDLAVGSSDDDHDPRYSSGESGEQGMGRRQGVGVEQPWLVRAEGRS